MMMGGNRLPHPLPSYAGLTRVSINLRKNDFGEEGWMAGSSPAMTLGG
jgi:hypothetical protein